MVRKGLAHRGSEKDEASDDLLQDIEASKDVSSGETGNRMRLAFCACGLQASYLIWGYVQEKVMTKEYETGRFPSATFCVFSNRVCAIVVAMVICYRRHGTIRMPAPLLVFAPCSISNSLSSWAQYQALRYVSFPLQTLSKSTKVIPVMLMGKVLNKKTYPWREYAEALLISVGVSVFSFSERTSSKDAQTNLLGALMLVLYVGADSFTSQWQSRVYKEHPATDQYQMMYAVNLWSIVLTTLALLISGELWVTMEFLRANPDALLDNITIAVTSATGQLFIFYTIKAFGPVTFTLIMTTRQMFSMMLSASLFGHKMTPMAYVGLALVFCTLFAGVRNRPARPSHGDPKAKPKAKASSENTGSTKKEEAAKPRGRGPAHPSRSAKS